MSDRKNHFIGRLKFKREAIKGEKKMKKNIMESIDVIENNRPKIKTFDRI
jgi:hypothetical protein